MSELLLDSLEIKGYRCFEHLTIEKLGRVNLIVGKNNVGKTALLEALWIYAQRNQGVLFDILISRNECPEISLDQFGRKAPTLVHLWAGRNIFFGRPSLQTQSSPVIATIKPHDSNRITTVVDIHGVPSSGEIHSNFPSVSVSFHSQDNQISPMPLISHYIKPNGLSGETLAGLWDEIALTSKEGNVNEALRLIDEKVRNVNFIGYPKGENNRVAVVRIEGLNEPVPLRSRGEGMNRLLGIALALVNCKDGMLLIDEVESGLHYTVLPDVWRLIFKTARELNVQVFATTHSSDCIYAFQKAADEDKESDGMLIRLVRKNDKIKAVLFDEEEMETVVEQNIEVR